MSKKKPFPLDGLVYSTDPNFKISEQQFGESETIPSSQQKLKIRLDTKNRAGKAVTIVEGFTGKQADADDLGKKLKTYCGTGGSVKGSEIIVQGDQRDKIVLWLQKNGYPAAKKI